MGNDGGSIPTRRELVKEAARNPSTAELKAAAAEAEQHRWTTDPLSDAPLARPVVADALGRLYNKDAVIEHLLLAGDADADDVAAVAAKRRDEVLQGAAVKSLKDVVEVRFCVEGEDGDDAGGVRKTEGEEATLEGEGARRGRVEREVWVCPITRERLGPGSKAVFLVPCGHAFKGEVIKEAGGERCNEPYAPNDVIPIIPTAEEDIARLQLRAKTLKEKGLTHSLKKVGGKKRKNGGDDKDGKATKKEKKEKKAAAAADGIKNSATASLTARVLAEQEERNKRRKIENNENLSSLFRKDQNKPGKNSDFMTRGFNIPAQAKR
ncbi:Replication termination factor 2 [Diplodia intermedia]|uniref:Replication termination factor 2 n=1 Tax=Diplodia intermedia TaxID=856260 RepID=A0ABR3TEU4_9PEZI